MDFHITEHRGQYVDGHRVYLTEDGRLEITSNLWMAGRRERTCRWYDSVETYIVQHEEFAKHGVFWTLRHFKDDLAHLVGTRVLWAERAPHHVFIERGGDEDLSSWERPSPEQVVVNPEGLEAELTEKKAFAKQQRKHLGDLGFTEQDIQRIISAAGPGRAGAAVHFALRSTDGAPWGTAAVDALLGLIGGFLSPRNCTGHGRISAALDHLGYLVPDAAQTGTRQGLCKFLRGVQAALLSSSWNSAAQRWAADQLATELGS